MFPICLEKSIHSKFQMKGFFFFPSLPNPSFYCLKTSGLAVKVLFFYIVVEFPMTRLSYVVSGSCQKDKAPERTPKTFWRESPHPATGGPWSRVLPAPRHRRSRGSRAPTQPSHRTSQGSPRPSLRSASLAASIPVPFVVQYFFSNECPHRLCDIYHYGNLEAV